MPTTRNQNKARKSRGLELLSDIENLDIMLGERHSERDVSAYSNSVGIQNTITSDMFENNDENMYLNNVETRPGNSTSRDQISASGNSCAEINKLSSELDSRLSRKMDEIMSSVNAQIQRAINDAISNQLLPQMQSAIRTGSGHLTQNRWNVPAERPELNSEDCRSGKPKSSSRSEHVRDCPVDNHQDNAYDTYKPKC